MNKLSRKNFESNLIDCLEHRLSGQGYFKEKLLGDIYLKREYENDVFWRLKISLCNKTFPYNFLDAVSVEHHELTLTLMSLLDSSLKNSWRCITGNHVRNYWQPANPVTIDSEDDMDLFVDRYLLALHVTEAEFLRLYSDVQEVIRRCLMFYTKWPKGMGPFDTALCLIAYGLKYNNNDYIQIGSDRIYEKRNWGHSDSVRYIPFFIRNKMIHEGKANGELLPYQGSS